MGLKEGIVVVHGFGGSPKDVQSVKIELSKYYNSNDIYTPLLYGHEGNDRVIEIGTKYTEIVDDLQKYVENLKKKYDRIILIGYSMGGLVCGSIAGKTNIDKLVLINAPIRIWCLTSFMHWFLEDLKQGKTYHLKTVLSTFQINRLRASLILGELEKYFIGNISKISCDTFVIQSTRDYVAAPTSGEYILNNISSKNKKLKTYNTHHFIPDEPIVEDVVRDINTWLKKAN